MWACSTYTLDLHCAIKLTMCHSDATYKTNSVLNVLITTCSFLYKLSHVSVTELLFIQCFTLPTAETDSLNEVAAHVLQPCEGTQDNMVIINLSINEQLIMVSTPFGFSCATNECRDVSANVIGPCELKYMITVRMVNCNNNLSGKKVYREEIGLTHMC